MSTEEHVCSIENGWKGFTYIGSTADYGAVKGMVDDPSGDWWRYYEDEVLPKSALPLTIALIWLLILLIYIIWRVVIIIERCFCGQNEWRESSYAKFLEVLTGTTQLFSKIILSIFGILTLLWYIWGIVSLASVANQASRIFDLVTNMEAQLNKTQYATQRLSATFQSIPAAIVEANQTLDENLRSLQQEELLSQLLMDVNAVVDNATGMLNVASSTLQIEVIDRIEEFKMDHQDDYEDIYDYIQIVGVYLLFPIGVILIVITIFCTIYNYTFGMEIDLILLIILTLAVVCLGLAAANGAVAQNDSCNYAEALVIFVVEKERGILDVVSAVTRHVLLNSEGGIKALMKRHFGYDHEEVLGYIQQLDNYIVNFETQLGQVQIQGLERIFESVRELPYKIDLVLNLVSYEELNVFYVQAKDISCCELRSFLIDYNRIAVIAGLLTLPVVAMLFVWLRYLRNLPPSRFGCSLCYCRNVGEFQLSLPVFTSN